MKWYKNLKVRNKMLLAFVAVILLVSLAGAYLITGMIRIDDNYSKAMDLTGRRIDYIFASKDHYSRARMIMREIYYPDVTRESLVRYGTELDAEIDALIHELKSLQAVAAPAVQEKVKAILPQVERYRNDSKDAINKLLAIDDISQENPVYRDAMVQANHLTVEVGVSYADDLTAEITGLSDMAIQVLYKLAADNSADASYTLYISLGVFILVALVSMIIATYISGLIARPLTPLAKFMKKAGATGDIVFQPDDLKIVNRYSDTKDEIGETLSGAISFMKHVTNVADELQSVAKGDLTVDIGLLSDLDTMGTSLKNVVDNLNGMFEEISMSANQASTGAKQISDGAQELAQGATEQAASIQQLSSSIAEIAQKTKENADTAERASALTAEIKDNAEKGSRQMDAMILAVKDVNDASHSISKIINTIDDIAFQTNILALNAAVEAARAGQHGKGFAVVAEEVRNLAAKSSEAAKNTANMIQDSMEKAEFGSRIAGETAASLNEIVSGVIVSSELIADIAKSSGEQSVGITQINVGIDQVAQVVQQNSATAEQSAAASAEMSGQAGILQSLVEQFKIKNGARRMDAQRIDIVTPNLRALSAAKSGARTNAIFAEKSDLFKKF